MRIPLPIVMLGSDSEKFNLPHQLDQALDSCFLHVVFDDHIYDIWPFIITEIKFRKNILKIHKPKRSLSSVFLHYLYILNISVGVGGYLKLLCVSLLWKISVLNEDSYSNFYIKIMQKYCFKSRNKLALTLFSPYKAS